MSEPAQANSELAIFRLLVEAARLPVVPSSVQKRQPPEPDVLCEISGLGVVAFELVEIVDQGFAGMVNGQVRVELALHRAVGQAELAQRSRLIERFGDALIYVRYLDPRVRRRERTIPALFRYLLDLPLGVEGDNEAEWVLVDLGDVIVHVMLPRIREYYAIERLWTVGDQPPELDELN